MEGTRRSHNGQPKLLTRLVSTDGTNHNANCGLSGGAGQPPRRPVGGGAARRSDPEPCCFSQAASALSSRAGPPVAVTAPGGFGGAPGPAALLDGRGTAPCGSDPGGCQPCLGVETEFQETTTIQSQRFSFVLQSPRPRWGTPRFSEDLPRTHCRTSLKEICIYMLRQVSISPNYSKTGLRHGYQG
jgi:hypothetical protein